MTTYQQAQKYLTEPSTPPTLTWLNKLLLELGSPHKSTKYIHVAGTNGKGSICNAISKILTECGYKVGLFTSPYVKFLQDEIQINGQPIPTEDFKRILTQIIDIITKNKLPISKFEARTAIMFKWFSEQQCDIAVLEVGLGGRFDSTNVIGTPLLSVISSISLDHTKVLGGTLAQIAKEKCGIIKPNGITVLYPVQSEQALARVKETCRIKNNKLIIPNIQNIKITSQNITGTTIRKGNQSYHIPLLGDHQVKNFSVVLSTIDELKEQNFKIDEKTLKKAIKSLKFPLRFEITSKEPLIILDGAHNPDGIKALGEAIQTYLHGKNIIGIFGMLQRKESPEMCLRKIAPFINELILTQTNSPPGYSPSLLASYANKIGGCICAVESSYEAAINKALNMYKPNDAIVVFGSLFLAMKSRELLKS